MAHLSWVHRWVTYVVGLPEGQKPARDAVPQWSEGDGDVRAWYGWGFDALLEALRSVPPDKPVFTLAGVQPASWWIRRIAHETAIHRWDAEQAAGAGEQAGGPAATAGCRRAFPRGWPPTASKRCSR